MSGVPGEGGIVKKEITKEDISLLLNGVSKLFFEGMRNNKEFRYLVKEIIVYHIRDVYKQAIAYDTFASLSEKMAERIIKHLEERPPMLDDYFLKKEQKAKDAFDCGPATVETWAYRDDGSVMIAVIHTATQKAIQILVYPNGKIRVTNNTQNAEFMEGK